MCVCGQIRSQASSIRRVSLSKGFGGKKINVHACVGILVCMHTYMHVHVHIYTHVNVYVRYIHT